jgi:C4-dicarboxylate-specific signal transduction histidine kinase
VCKIDVAEVEAPVRVFAVQVATAAASVLFGIGAGLVALWWRTVGEAARERLESEQARIRTLENLRKSEEATRALVTSIPETALLLEPSGAILALNVAARRQLGLDASASPGAMLLDLLPAEWAARWSTHLDDVSEKGQPDRIEETTDGRVLTIRFYPLVDDAGHVARIAVLGTDVTREREYERVERMGALGRLTAGVAHELSNPLMGILNFAQYCLARTEKDDARYDVLRDIESATRRCVGLVEDLLGSSWERPGIEGRAGDVDVAEVAERVIRIVGYRVRREGVTVDFEVDTDLPRLQAAANKLEQLLVNLVVNALDAVEPAADKRVRIVLAGEEHAVRLEVSDSGAGIPAELRERVFEPFFTTKPPGRGTGLGLAVVSAIVRDMGGRIHLKSAPAEGTTVTLTIPRLEQRGVRGPRTGQ